MDAQFVKQIDDLYHYLEAKLPNAHVCTYLLDIEGTTTALPFVTKVLFPYAEQCIESYVAKMYPLATAEPSDDTDDTILFKNALKEASQQEMAKDYISCEKFISLLKEAMATNSKVSFLKSIQGVLWRSGYQNGEIKGHVFDDTATLFKNVAQGYPHTHIEIYSSGSIAAQKLLFKYSDHGDLVQFISGYHDPTTVGKKIEPQSYQNIRKRICGKPIDRHIIFFTDSVAEVEACVASEAIDACVFFRRPLNTVPSAEEEIILKRLQIPSIVSFSQFESAMRKLRKEEELEHMENGSSVHQSLNSQVQQFVDGPPMLREFT